MAATSTLGVPGTAAWNSINPNWSYNSLGVPTGTSGAGSATAPALDKTAAHDLLNFEDQANTDAATAKSQGIISAGDAAEAAQYGMSADTAVEQARMERISGSIKDFQEQANIYKTTSGQMSDVAASGFGNSGSALYLMRNSYNQGALTRQITQTNTAISAGGYDQQASAALAEQDAAMAASGAAQALADSASQAGVTARTNALNYATSLTPGGAPFVPAGLEGSSLAQSVQGILGVTPGTNPATGASTITQPYAPSGGGGGGAPRVINNGGTGDAADRMLGGTLNLDPTGGGLL